MKEELLQFAWMFKSYSHLDLITDTLEEIQIIDPGQLNHDSGPDFFNAKVKISGTLWVGNIELHLKSSDWYKHQHQTNKQYNNVILHVVQTCDQPTYNQKGNRVPTLQLKLQPGLLNKYEFLTSQATAIPCGSNLYRLNNLYLNSWITTVMHEKLQQKYDDISRVLVEHKNDWQETFYIFLSRNFGFGLNGSSFEMLAKSLPYRILIHHLDNPTQTEALLFGQAGFLDELLAEDDYYNHLRNEYLFLAKKYTLIPMDKSVWKFLRLRPNNFPTVRIAQLSSILTAHPNLFRELMASQNLTELLTLTKSEATAYWSDHYRFNVNKTGDAKPKKLGRTTGELIILNTIIPFLFAYGKYNGDDLYCDRAFGLLEKMKAEKNHIITRWGRHNIIPENAFQSQALIYLYNYYCILKKCLNCQIGHHILTKDR